MDNNGNTLALIPGCQVKAWVHCKTIPKTTDTGLYEFKGE